MPAEQCFASRLGSAVYEYEEQQGAVPTRTLLGIAPTFCFALLAASACPCVALQTRPTNGSRIAYQCYLLCSKTANHRPEKALSYCFSRDSGAQARKHLRLYMGHPQRTFRFQPDQPQIIPPRKTNKGSKTQ